MKKIILALSAIALMATACDKKTSKDNDTDASEINVNGVAVSAEIVYFEIDSLVSKYDMYIDLRAAYEEKASKAEAELEKKGQAFQRKAKSYQYNAENGLMTRAEMEKTATNLQNEESALMAQQQKAMAEFNEEEQVLMNKIHHSITEHLKEYNSDGRYGMILSSTSSSGPVMAADPSLNITKELLDGLNKKYAATLKSTTAAPAGAVE